MRLLILDKHAQTIDVVRDTASAGGWEVHVASSAAEAVAMAGQSRPQLILMTDHPEGCSDCLDLMRRLKRNDRQGFIIIVCDPGEEELAIEALRHGAANYLIRPIRRLFLTHLLDKYARTVESMERQALVRGLIVSQRKELEIPNDGSLVGPVVDHILREVEELYPGMDTSGIHLGLEEIIRNAIEHGNLEIGFETKSEALREYRLADVVRDRMKDPAYSTRRVRVRYLIENAQLHCSVEDEGPGFDYQRAWDPLSDAGMERLNGRGIFLTRAFFDSVEYSGRGNRVDLVKSLAAENACV